MERVLMSFGFVFVFESVIAELARILLLHFVCADTVRSVE